MEETSLKLEGTRLAPGSMTQGAREAAASLRDRPVSYRSYEEFHRSRAKQLKTASQRRLQSTAVDFRRVWWDKDTRYPSKSGLSFWRPIPPQGYISLGALSAPCYAFHNTLESLSIE